MQRLAWVTAGAVRGTDVDEPVALAALRAAGTDVEVVDWDDPQVDWAAFDRAVLRSTWTTTSGCRSSCAGSTRSRR